MAEEKLPWVFERKEKCFMAKISLMTEGKPLPLMLKFAVPMIIGNALQMMYNIADSAVVGRMIGVDAFAAVGVAGNFNWLVFSVLLGLSQGFGTVLAQYFGAGDTTRFRKCHTMSWVLTAILGVIISIVAFVVTRPVMILMNTPPEILEDTVVYLQITFAGFIFVFANNTASALFRAIGNSQLPVNIMFVSGVVNIGLNVLLVKVTDWGVGAVAFATLVSQVLGTAIFIYFIIKTKVLRVKKTDWQMEPQTCKELLRIGFPIGFRNLVIAIGGIVIQFFINSYGTIFIAGISVTKRLYALLEIIGAALQGAAATFVAQNYGAKRFDRIKKGVRDAMLAMLVSSAAMMLLMFIFGRNISSLLIAGDTGQVNEVLDVAVEQLSFMLGFLPALFLLLLYQTAIQSMGNSLLPTVGGFIEMLIRIGTVLALAGVMGKWGIYLSEVLAWPICAVIYIVGYRYVFKIRCQTFGVCHTDGKTPLEEKAKAAE